MKWFKNRWKINIIKHACKKLCWLFGFLFFHRSGVWGLRIERAILKGKKNIILHFVNITQMFRIYLRTSQLQSKKICKIKIIKQACKILRWLFHRSEGVHHLTKRITILSKRNNIIFGHFLKRESFTELQRSIFLHKISYSNKLFKVQLSLKHI